MIDSSIFMNLFGIFAAVFVLSILVAVHEAGHLLMAKWSNVRVDVFSIGMGKPIWGFQYGETYYQIGMLPFGGFCGFGIEENGDKDDPDPRALGNSPLWARLLTVIGGSLFNIIFAYLVMVLMFGVGFKETQISNEIHVPKTITLTTSNEIISSPAYEAGLRSGDRIIKIDNSTISHFMQIPASMALSANPQKTIIYIRNNTTNTNQVISIPDFETGLDIIGIGPLSPAIISKVLKNSPAESASLQEKDQIIAINGRPISFFYELSDFIQQGKILNLTVLRSEETNNISVTPKLDTNSNLWQIGIQGEFPHQVEISQKAPSFIKAFSMSAENISHTLSQIGASLSKLFSGKVDLQKNLSGPVRIVSITGEIAQSFNFPLLVKFMVMLSLALAVFNMLPFPGLDGGHVVLQTARSIFHKNETATKVINWIEQVGMFILLAIAVFVLFNDIKTLSKESSEKKQTQQQLQDK